MAVSLKQIDKSGAMGGQKEQSLDWPTGWSLETAALGHNPNLLSSSG